MPEEDGIIDIPELETTNSTLAVILQNESSFTKMQFQIACLLAGDDLEEGTLEEISRRTGMSIRAADIDVLERVLFTMKLCISKKGLYYNITPLGTVPTVRKSRVNSDHQPRRRRIEEPSFNVGQSVHFTSVGELVHRDLKGRSLRIIGPEDVRYLSPSKFKCCVAYGDGDDEVRCIGKMLLEAVR